MKFKIDENLPNDVVTLLRDSGFDALSVLDQDLGGSPDNQIYEVCKNEERIIITLDTDFSNILSFPPSESPGIIVLRSAQQDKETILTIMDQIVDMLSEQEIAKKLWIVSKDKIRIRE